MTLAEIQAAVKAPKTKRAVLPKGQYDYRSLEDIVKAAKMVLNPAGLGLLMTDRIKPEGTRWYVYSTAKIVDGEGKTLYEAEGAAREPDAMSSMSAPQITGSASSYARKYALGGLLAIDNSLPDADELPQEEAPPVQAKPVQARPQGAATHQAIQGASAPTNGAGKPSKAILADALKAAGVTTASINRAIQLITSNRRQTWREMSESDSEYFVKNPGIWNEALALLKAKGVVA